MILKYTDYKKQQALWLQRENEKRTDRGTNDDQFFIKCYRTYLNICGIKKHDEQIDGILDKIGTYYLNTDTGRDFFGNIHDENIHNNIDKIMDFIIGKQKSVSIK